MTYIIDCEYCSVFSANFCALCELIELVATCTTVMNTCKDWTVILWLSVEKWRQEVHCTLNLSFTSMVSMYVGPAWTVIAADCGCSSSAVISIFIAQDSAFIILYSTMTFNVKGSFHCVQVPNIYIMYLINK